MSIEDEKNLKEVVSKLLVIQKHQEEQRLEKKRLEEQLQNYMLKTKNLKIVADQSLCETLEVPHSFWTVSERIIPQNMKREEEIQLWTQFLVNQSGQNGKEQTKNVEKMVVSGFEYLKNKRTKLKKTIFKKSTVRKTVRMDHPQSKKGLPSPKTSN